LGKFSIFTVVVLSVKCLGVKARQLVALTVRCHQKDHHPQVGQVNISYKSKSKPLDS